MSEFTHLPPDMRTALDDYDERVADGALAFDPEASDPADPDKGFAHYPYPGDPRLTGFLAAHLPGPSRLTLEQWRKGGH